MSGLLGPVPGLVVGASGAKNTIEGNVISGTLQVGAAAVLGSVENLDYRYAGFPVAVGMASSGWSDMATLNVRRGVTKILLASAIATGTNAAVSGQEFGEIKLKEVGIATAMVAGVGLAHAVGSKIFGWMIPVLKSEISDLFDRAKEDCRKTSERRRELRQPYHAAGSSYI